MADTCISAGALALFVPISGALVTVIGVIWRELLTDRAEWKRIALNAIESNKRAVSLAAEREGL